ncbi:MAG: DUF433 domain-containing protein [Fibrobacteres bacterium]|nr:DUF433 domain-containing protein [Fibrobacterota bacterium]
MRKHPLIEMNPAVMTGKPVIKGTRITVDIILRKLSSGATVEEILEDYPNLTIESILAAESFAADFIADEEIVVYSEKLNA